MTADDLPTIPAIPLRVRQKHRPRSKKLAVAPRWQGRRPSEVEVEVEVVPDAGIEQAFFRSGDDSLAPSTLDETDAPKSVPSDPRRVRALARIVGGAVVLASFLCVAAFVGARERRPTVVSGAPTSVPLFAAAIPAEEPPPPEPEPVVDAPTAPSASELREQARAHLAAHRLPDAIDAGRRAVDADPEEATAWLILGAAQMEAGRGSDAAVSFRTCTRVARSGPVAECRAFVR